MTSVLAKNAGKAFIHRIKIYCLVTTLYEVFNRLQAFLFKIHNHRKEISSSFVTKEKIIFNRRPKKKLIRQVRLNDRLNINADM